MNRRGATGLRILLLLTLVAGVVALACFVTVRSDGVLSTESEDRSTSQSAALIAVSQPAGLGITLFQPGREPFEAQSLHPDSEQAMDRELRTHAQVMVNDALLTKVLSNPNMRLRGTEWYRSIGNVRDAKEWLSRRLRAQPIAGSRLIKVYIEGFVDRGDSKIILEDLINAHIEDQNRAAQERIMTQTQVLSNLKLRFENRQRELLDRQNNRAMQLNLTQVAGRQFDSATDIEFREAVRRDSELRSQAMQDHSARESFASKVAAGIDPPDVLETAEKDPTVHAYREKLAALDLDLRIAKAGASTEDVVRDLQNQRDAYQQELDRILPERIQRVRLLKLTALESAATHSADEWGDIRKKVEQLKGILGDLAIAEADYVAVTTDLDATRADLRDIRNKLDFLGSAAAPSPVIWMQKPDGKSGGE
ncbi:MAG: hypothetical protein ACREJC_19445 [Tepidisphaeraceae bacterium]